MKKLLLTTAAIIAVAFTGNAQYTTNGLLLHYDFKGNANDVSGNGHNASATNVTYISSPYNCSDQAVQITPTSTINYDYTNHTTDFETQSYSCVVRVKINSLPNTYTNFLEIGDPSVYSSYFRLRKTGMNSYVAQGGFYNEIAGTGSNIELSLNETLSSITDGNYHYFGIVADYNSSNNSRTMKLYIDGVLKQTNSFPNSTLNYPAGYSTIHLGGRPNTQTMNLDGNMDDLSFYNRALSNSEMTSSMPAIPSVNSVYIPDANFKNYLVGNSAINTNGNTEIECSEAAAFTGTISCPSLGISNLTGIEHFTALTGLVCNNNQLTALNLSNNPALTSLICHDNALTLLNIDNNIALTSIDCKSNQLTSLNVSNNTALTSLACHYNQLNSLDLSSNSALTALACRNNQLTSLNVKNGNNTNMTLLWAQNNPNLTCIQVDNEIYSTTNWTGPNFMIGTIFSENCNLITAPTTLSATLNNNPLSISLLWTDNSTNEAGFKVERSTDGTNFTEIADVQGNSTSYTDNNVTGSITYYYRVYAYNTNAVSDFSNTVEIIATINCNIQMTHQIGTGSCPNVEITINNATFPITLDLSWPGNNPITMTIYSSPYTYSTMCAANYTLTATDIYNCSETINFTVGNTGINDNILNTVSVYPNPATSFVTLENIPVESIIEILDVTGKVIHTTTVNETSTQIETNTFMNGVYHIQISDPLFGAVTKKLVINK